MRWRFLGGAAMIGLTCLLLAGVRVVVGAEPSPP
jgi:hypothetical protein